MTTRLRTPIVHALRRPQSLLGLPHPVGADLPLLLVVPAYLLQLRDRSLRYHHVGDTVAVCTASLLVSSFLFRSALMARFLVQNMFAGAITVPNPSALRYSTGYRYPVGIDHQSPMYRYLYRLCTARCESRVTYGFSFCRDLSHSIWVPVRPQISPSCRACMERQLFVIHSAVLPVVCASLCARGKYRVPVPYR
jgi:hypothetical protein